MNVTHTRPSAMGSEAWLDGRRRAPLAWHRTSRYITVALLVWFAMVMVLGRAGTFIRSRGEIPYPIVIAVTAPVLIALMAFGMSEQFRRFVRSIDLPLITFIQSWRFIGFGFLALNAHGLLPGIFAWPAGLGDMAIGVSAPWVGLALIRRPGFVGSRFFKFWNMLGILDLIVAVGLGALSASLGLGADGAATESPMARLPLVLVPAWLVPLFAMLHLVALYQGRLGRYAYSALEVRTAR